MRIVDSVEMPKDEITDGDLLVLRKAAHSAGVPSRVVMASRKGGRRKPWLHLRFREAWYLYAGGILLHSDAAAEFGAHVNGQAPRITSNKWRTQLLLQSEGLPVPETRKYEVGEQDEAVRFASVFGAVCIKPNRGAKGTYVYPDLRDEPKRRAAFRKAQRLAGGVLVQEHLDGEVLRFFYIMPSVVAVKINKRPMVTGDGLSTIAELVDRQNLQLAHAPWYRPIIFDHEALRALANQNLEPKAVLANAVSAFLGFCSNVARGGASYVCQDIHASYADVARAAFAAVPELLISTLDMIVAQRQEAARSGNHWILEINSAPGLDDFIFISSGDSIDVARLIIDFLIKRHEAGAQPATA